MRSAERTLEKRCEMSNTERPLKRSRIRVKRSCSARASSAADDRVEVVDPIDPTEPDVLARGEHEAREVLEQDGDALVDPPRVSRRDIDAIPQDSTGVGPVQARED